VVSRVVHHSTEDKLMDTHHSFIEAFFDLGYSDNKEGCCNGLTLRWLEACLSNEEKIFHNRIRKINMLRKQLPQKVEVMKAKKGNKLNAEDRELLEILAFCESVKQYQIPETLTDLFSSSGDLNQYDIELISKLASSDQIQSRGGLIALYSEPMIYQISEIKQYLDDLRKLLEQNTGLADQIYGLTISNHEHTVGLTYITGKGWRFMDINQYPAKFFSISDTKRLVQKISSGLKSDNSLYIAFNTQLISTGKARNNPRLKKALATFKQTHFITKEIAQRTEVVNLAFMATRYGHKEILQQLIHHKTNITCTDDQGYNLRHTAVINRNTDLIALLAQNGVNINESINQAWSPLIFAAQKGYANCVAELAKHGADLDYAASLGCTAAHYAAQYNYPQVLNELALQKANLNALNHQGHTPAHCAAERNAPAALLELAAHKANLNITDKAGLTPIFYAIQNGHLQALNTLINSGISPCIPDKAGKTLLHHAAEHNQTQFVNLLCNYGINPNQADSNGWTAAHYAAQNNHADLITELLNNGANLNSTDTKNKSPIFYAVQFGCCKSFIALANAGVELNNPDEHGKTLVHYAASYDQPQIIHELAKRGVDLNAEDGNNWSPVIYTVQHQSLEALNELIKYKINLHVVDKYGFSLSHYAAQGGYTPIITKLIRLGVFMDTPDALGFRPIHYAIQEGNKTALLELIKTYGIPEKPTTITIDEHQTQETKVDIDITPQDIALITDRPHLLPMLNKASLIRQFYKILYQFKEDGQTLVNTKGNPKYAKEGQKILDLTTHLEKNFDQFIIALCDVHFSPKIASAKKEFKRFLNQGYLEIQTYKYNWKPALNHAAYFANKAGLVVDNQAVTKRNVFFAPKPRPRTVKSCSDPRIKAPQI
jgi:ankyrin repeat protein